MKYKFPAILTLALTIIHAQAAPIGTAFTYQGQLNTSGSRANGSYDLQFSLFDAVTNGNAVGATLTNSAVAVSNGLFTVTLDFGDSAFDGSSLWLAIGARTNGGGAFTGLNPRQAILPVPYAVTAANATTAANLTGTLPPGALTGTYGAALTLTNSTNQLTGTFTGNGAAVTNVNAATLGGVAATNFWKTSGNAGVVPPTSFLGTTDNQPLELRVKSLRALRLEPNTNGAPNVIGGASANLVDVGVSGAIIAGGGATNYGGSPTNSGVAYTNRISADFGVVSGGLLNSIAAGAFDSVISGGFTNIIQTNAYQSNIGGGAGNVIAPWATDSTIAGGINNLIATNAYQSVIGGGVYNFISTNASNATIPGGSSNVCAGNGSFAAGQNAVAQHSGAFVWGDDSGVLTFSTNANSITMRAAGGVRIFSNAGAAGVRLAVGGTAWAVLSDRNVKKNITPLDSEAVLEKLAQVPVSEWNYQWEADGTSPHIGPMAQDFKGTFYPGTDDKSITTLEFDGVELAAIQGLNRKLEARVKTQQDELNELKVRLATLEKMMSEKAASHQ